LEGRERVCIRFSFCVSFRFFSFFFFFRMCSLLLWSSVAHFQNRNKKLIVTRETLIKTYGVVDVVVSLVVVGYVVTILLLPLRFRLLIIRAKSHPTKAFLSYPASAT
jgi:hypothetical protein